MVVKMDGNRRAGILLLAVILSSLLIMGASQPAGAQPAGAKAAPKPVKPQAAGAAAPAGAAAKVPAAAGAAASPPKPVTPTQKIAADNTKALLIKIFGNHCFIGNMRLIAFTDIFYCLKQHIIRGYSRLITHG